MQVEQQTKRYCNLAFIFSRTTFFTNGIILNVKSAWVHPGHFSFMNSFNYKKFVSVLNFPISFVNRSPCSSS